MVVGNIVKGHEPLDVASILHGDNLKIVPFLKNHGDISISTAVAGTLTALFVISLIWDKLDSKRHPWALSTFAYFPRWFSGLVWAFGSLDIMNEIHSKFKDRAVRVVRPDTDLLIIPRHAVQEVSVLKDEVASNLAALEQDLNARFSGIGGFRNSHLHDQYVQKKITPNLPGLVPGMEKEISRCIAEELAAAENDWQDVAVHPFLTKLSTRVSARLMLGEKYSTSKEWFEISNGFLNKMLETVFILRFFPEWFQPVLHYIMPSRYATTNFTKRARKMLRPVFADILKKQAAGNWTPSPVEEGENWGVEHITDLASGSERNADFLVHSEILLIMASIPTTVITETNALFDAVARPQYMDMVRQELAKVSDAEPAYTLPGLKKLYKLDSFLRESQRVNPPTLIGLRRIMKKDHVLKSGLLLPKGAYVCAPVYVIQKENTDDPDRFDGLRSYRQRIKPNGEIEERKHTFISSEPTVLAFGLGTSACPGRYLADATVKLIIAKLINEYDMKLPDGQTERLENLKTHEFNFPVPTATVLMKRRQPST